MAGGSREVCLVGVDRAAAHGPRQSMGLVSRGPAPPRPSPPPLPPLPPPNRARAELTPGRPFSTPVEPLCRVCPALRPGASRAFLGAACSVSVPPSLVLGRTRSGGAVWSATPREPQEDAGQAQHGGRGPRNPWCSWPALQGAASTPTCPAERGDADRWLPPEPRLPVPMAVTAALHARLAQRSY